MAVDSFDISSGAAVLRAMDETSAARDKRTNDSSSIFLSTWSTSFFGSPPFELGIVVSDENSVSNGEGDKATKRLE